MININELKSLQDNITGFYSNFVSKKRVNKKDLIELYINDKLAKSILLLNLKSELNNCEKGYNFLIQTLSYQNKKDIISAIKEIKKEYPEIYDGVLTGFKILIKMKYDVENLLNILEREVACIDNKKNIDNKEKLNKIYKDEEIPLLIKISEKNKIWNLEFNRCASKLKSNRNFSSLVKQRKSEMGGATMGSLSMLITIATFIVGYHQIKNPGVEAGSDALFILQTMLRDGLLAGVLGLILFGATIKLFKK